MEEKMEANEEVAEYFKERERLPSTKNKRRNMVGTCDNCDDITHTEDVGGGRRLCYHCREEDSVQEFYEYLSKIKEEF